MSDSAGKVYIVTVRHGIRDEVLFWRPGASGYTTRLDEAGVYPRGKAASPDIAIPVEVAERLAVRMVPAEALAEAVDEYRRAVHGEREVREDERQAREEADVELFMHTRRGEKP